MKSNFMQSRRFVSSLEKYCYKNISITWDKVFKNGPSKIFWKTAISLQIF